VKKLALWTIVFVGVATPAMAANFWVVKDAATQKCTIVEQDQKPGSTTVIGNAHATRAEAESVVNRNVQCGGAD
jgi:hypothetical protein